ncbi:MAG: hypothetical protein PHV30_08395 [Candidatus Margulisbacteria bacterium]|nr:hypothetical protein [Candidatus Margulisiibacteriota bacterium]
MEKIKINKNPKFTLLITVLLMLSSSGSFAGFFLDNGIGLKGMQMGGAYTASPEGTDAIFWNPAKLSDTYPAQIYGTYSEKFGEVKEYSFLYSTQLDEKSGIGAAYIHAGVDDIIQYSTTSQNMGTFSFGNDALLLGYGYKLDDSKSMGLTVKNITQKAIDQASFISFDLAYHMVFGEGTHLGLVAQDIYATGTEIKPVYRVGLSKQMGEFQVNGDYMLPILLNQGFFKLGVSYDGLKPINIKAGYNDYDKLLYLGMSVTLHGFTLDYLFSNPDLGTVHQFGFGYNF